MKTLQSLISKYVMLALSDCTTDQNHMLLNKKILRQ